MARAYHLAVASIRPSRAEMQRRFGTYAEDTKAARAAVKAEILAGADPRALYEAENAKPERGDRFRALALLGVLRRGMAALD